MTTSEEKKAAFNKAANDRYLANTTKTFEELKDYFSYEKNNWADGCTGDEWETIEDAIDCGQEAADQYLEEEREQIEASKVAAALGRKGGKSRSEAKRAAGAKNCKKLNTDPAVRKVRSERMKMIHEGKRVITEFGRDKVAQWFEGDNKDENDGRFAVVAKMIREGKGQYDVGLFANMIRESLND